MDASFNGTDVSAVTDDGDYILIKTDASFSCINGGAKSKTGVWWTGEGEITFYDENGDKLPDEDGGEVPDEEEPYDGLMTASVAIGSLERHFTLASKTYEPTPETSQFRAMVEDEEDFHAHEQIEGNAADDILDDHDAYDILEVISKLNEELEKEWTNGTPIHRWRTKVAARTYINTTFNTLMHEEGTASRAEMSNTSSGLRCAVERQAKDHIRDIHGNLYIFDMECAYSGCN